MKPDSKTSAQRRVSVVTPSIVLLILFLLVPVAPIRAEDRPLIHVSFQFNGGMLELIPKNQRDAIQLKVEERICEQAEKRWGFLNWSNNPPTPATTDVAKWKVTFSVEVKQLEGSPLSTVGTLKHSGQFESMQYPFELTPDQDTIYPIERSIPTGNPTALGNDLIRSLDTQLRDLLEDPRVAKFLNKIPIAEKVIADTDIRKIVVPIKVSDLRTGLDSTLRVSFKEQDEAGLLDLKTRQEVLIESQNKGYVVGWVTALQHDSIEISDPAWGYEKLSPVISSWKEVKVYMLEYDSKLTGCPVTSDALDLDPFDCGEAQ